MIALDTRLSNWLDRLTRSYPLFLSLHFALHTSQYLTWPSLNTLCAIRALPLVLYSLITAAFHSLTVIHLMYVCLGDLALPWASTQITFDRKKVCVKIVRDGIQQEMACSRRWYTAGMAYCQRWHTARKITRLRPWAIGVNISRGLWPWLRDTWTWTMTLPGLSWPASWWILARTLSRFVG